MQATAWAGCESTVIGGHIKTAWAEDKKKASAAESIPIVSNYDETKDEEPIVVKRRKVKRRYRKAPKPIMEAREDCK